MVVRTVIQVMFTWLSLWSHMKCFGGCQNGYTGNVLVVVRTVTQVRIEWSGGCAGCGGLWRHGVVKTVIMLR